jgi:hypothetical protein
MRDSNIGPVVMQTGKEKVVALSILSSCRGSSSAPSASRIIHKSEMICRSTADFLHGSLPRCGVSPCSGREFRVAKESAERTSRRAQRDDFAGKA